MFFYSTAHFRPNFSPIIVNINIRMTKQHGDHDIVFPKYYEGIWNRGKGNDVYGAQALIADHINPSRSRMRPSISSRPFANDSELRRISEQKYVHVLRLLKDVKDRVFHSTHKSCIPGSLLQKMRFVFLKSRSIQLNQENIDRSLYKEIHRFYFDPTIHFQGNNHYLNKKDAYPSKVGLVYSYPIAPVHIVIVGGGPVGLICAINLFEMFLQNNHLSKIDIHIYDKRWKFIQGKYEYASKRRQQIVTIQDGVCQRMSTQTEEIFFGTIHERVWPHSRNISIMKIEDQLLQAVQSVDMKRVIHLHAMEVKPTDLNSLGPFHIIISAEGSHSKIRQHFFTNETHVKAQGYALSVAFNYPNQPNHSLDNTQALNVFFTLAQSRYLLNSSLSEGRGLLNMQLTQSEWDQVVRINGQRCTFGKPGKISTSSITEHEQPTSDDLEETFMPSVLGNELWRCIKDGLHLFGINQQNVNDIVGIPLHDIACKLGCKAIPSLARPNALAFVIGDAALSVHVWPGRGLNSGLKTAIACADVIANVIQTNRVLDLIPSSFSKYTDFLNRLEIREHEGRSLHMVNQSGDPHILLKKLNLESALIPDASSKFVKDVCTIAQRMEKRRDWTHAKVHNLENVIHSKIDQMSPMSIQDMTATGPWPIDEMTGPEAYPALEYQPIRRDSPAICCASNNPRKTSIN